MTMIDYGRLDDTRNRLLNEFKFLSFEQINQQPDTATWSIAQVCEHVSLAENSFAKAIRYGLRAEPVQECEPSKAIQILTDRSRKVDAPDIVNPGTEQLDVKQIVGMLNESRTLLLDILCSIQDPSVLTKKSVKHALFGELPLAQWIEVVYLHEQRHIEQIQEIKSRLS